MMNITKVIDEAVSSIHGYEEGKRQLAGRLQPIKEKDFSSLKSADILEERLFFPIAERELNERIAGVDSGFIGKRLASIDVVLIRAVGVVFDYKKGKVKKSSYYPSFFQFPTPLLTNNALEKDEYLCSKSLMRLREEVQTAKSIIEKYKPNYCFLDGSIVPQYQDKPRKESRVNPLYHNILNEFQLLYKTAEKNKCSLVACVEDSRGSRFRGILQESILPNEKLLEPEKLENLFDSSLLDYLLNLKERTAVFTYSKNIEKHPILMDYDKSWSNRIYGFYIKPSLYDRPLRIEFVYKGENLTDYCNEIASITLALSSLHREYAYPSILIEADMHAGLKRQEIDVVFNKIMDKLGKNIKLKMRRDNRPF